MLEHCVGVDISAAVVWMLCVHKQVRWGNQLKMGLFFSFFLELYSSDAAGVVTLSCSLKQLQFHGSLV